MICAVTLQALLAFLFSIRVNELQIYRDVPPQGDKHSCSVGAYVKNK